MQQHQKAVPTPSQNRQPEKADKTVKTAPIVLDEKALRQIAGGLTQSPNSGW
jgi:hypothetical protein